MPRPKLEEDRKRRREVAILLTGSESRAIREAAGRRSMRVSAFVRDAALTAAVEAIPAVGEHPSLEPDPDAVALRREIRRLGSNLNQLIALAHRGGDPNLRPAVEALRQAVIQVLTR